MTTAKAVTLCDACGERPASVFTPAGPTCRICWQHAKDHPPVDEEFAHYVRSLGGAGNRRFAKAPDVVDRIDDALDDMPISRDRDVEAFDAWVDSFDNEVDMSESSEVR